MFDVITIGSATRDVLLRMEDSELRRHLDSPTGIEQCFPLGSKLEIQEIVFTTGGGGTNSAVTFGRQGFKTGCVGVVGNDMIGREITEELKREKVKPTFQVHDDGDTAYSVILVHPDAERTILSYKGEGQHFDIKKIPLNKLKTKWLYLDSLGGHFDLFETLVNHAVKNGIKIACNPGGKEIAHGREKLSPLLANIDVFITNKEEGIQLLGEESTESLEWVLNELEKLVKGIVVLTDGHSGVRVRAGGREYNAGVPDSPVVERTGAGDAFGSGFMAEYIRKIEAGSKEPEAVMSAIQFGTANASSVVTKYGAKAGILHKGDYGPWPLVEVKESQVTKY
ncbi:MAG: carbohydrate kinase family protein [Candidatus Yanofskybacteria bacterium]|nr:carbohydrate kinase family protein [Candidatus Yanofskybacteria bacterium]